jgi:hypothetical protein
LWRTMHSRTILYNINAYLAKHIYTN